MFKMARESAGALLCVEPRARRRGPGAVGAGAYGAGCACNSHRSGVAAGSRKSPGSGAATRSAIADAGTRTDARIATVPSGIRTRLTCAAATFASGAAVTIRARVTARAGFTTWSSCAPNARRVACSGRYLCCRNDRRCSFLRSSCGRQNLQNRSRCCTRTR